MVGPDLVNKPKEKNDGNFRKEEKYQSITHTCNSHRTVLTAGLYAKFVRKCDSINNISLMSRSRITETGGI